MAPTVFSQALRINPLLVIFALLMGGRLYGIAGAFLALPLAAVVRETVVYLREHLVLEPWGTPSAAELPGYGAPPADAPTDAAAPSAARRGRGRPTARVRHRAGGADEPPRPPPSCRAVVDAWPRMAASRTDAPEALRADGALKSYGDAPRAPGRLVQRRAGRAAGGDRPNGAGKTTLLQILAGALEPTAGTRLARPPRGSAGCRSSRRSTPSSRCARTCGLFARLEKVATSAAPSSGCSTRPGSASARATRSGRSRAATSSGSTSRSGCSAIRRSCCSTSRRPRSIRASASACGSSSTRSRARRHDGRLLDPQRRRGRALRRPLLVLADGELLFAGTPAELEQATGEHEAIDFEGAFVRFLREPGALTRALAAAQGPADPAPLAAAGGAARALPAGRRAARRRRALLRSVEAEGRVRQPRAAGEAQINLGGQRLDATTYASELFENVDPIRVESREEAIAKVESGEALGALVIPPDVIERLQGALALGGGEPPTVEVYYSAENPLKRRYVEATIDATLADANKALSDEIFKEAAALPEPDRGGRQLVAAARRRRRHPRPAQRPARSSTARWPACRRTPVARRAAAGLALRAARGRQPRRLQADPRVDRARSASTRSALGGSSSSLDVFGVEVAVVLSLMFVTLLLAAGMLALEREEHAFGRLVRGLVSRTGLLAEKIGLAGLCAWALAAVMLAVLVAFLDLGWSRTPAWAARARGRGRRVRGARRRDRRRSRGGARGLAARVHARAPIAALALVPSGAVDGTLYDVIRIVSGAFPFRARLGAPSGRERVRQRSDAAARRRRPASSASRRARAPRRRSRLGVGAVAVASSRRNVLQAFDDVLDVLGHEDRLAAGRRCGYVASCGL